MREPERVDLRPPTAGGDRHADGRGPTSDQPLIEPLSERELEVLRLLDSDLDGPDIARELTVSLPTVRTHTRNIYAKLGVNSRRAAVRRAAELGLLAGERRRDARTPVASPRESSAHSSRVLMRAHHLRLHGVPSELRSAPPAGAPAGNTHEERNDRTTDPDTGSPRGRALRDPAHGAPRRALGRLVRRH